MIGPERFKSILQELLAKYKTKQEVFRTFDFRNQNYVDFSSFTTFFSYFFEIDDEEVL